MKISTVFACSSLVLSGASAFAPKAFIGSRGRNNVILSESKSPFFGSKKVEGSQDEQEGYDEELERMVQEEMKKKKKISNLRNAKGVDYAPWMKISKEDEEKIRQLMAEKAAARRRRQEQEREVSGALLYDSQAQELSGGGLQSKIVGQDVQLEWATASEANTKGFVLKRRAAKTDNFQVIASYEDWQPLVSQGPNGGIYRFLDDTAGPGNWVYRVTECEKDGRESDICQCLVEIQTEEEQKGAILAAGGIVALLTVLIIAGAALDPNGGF